MVEIPAVDVEKIFVPEVDLTAYETMAERDLYLALVKGVFDYQGKSTDDRNIMPPFVGIYVPVPRGAAKKTDETVTIVDGGDEMRVETSALEEQHAGIDWLWGPVATITLSKIDNGKIIKFKAATQQEHQELFMGATATILDPLTGKPESEASLMDFAWVGNTGNMGSDDDPSRFMKKSAFREVTPAEKRVIGVALEGLGQLAVAAR